MFLVGERVIVTLPEPLHISTDAKFQGQVGRVIIYNPTHSLPYKVQLEDDTLNVDFTDGRYIPFTETEVRKYHEVKVSLTRKQR